MKDDEAKKEDEPMYPKTDFYPFYMAKPTEEEIKEYEEKMKEYEEEMKKQEAEFKERQDKMKAEYEQHQEKMKAGFLRLVSIWPREGMLGYWKSVLFPYLKVFITTILPMTARKCNHLFSG